MTRRTAGIALLAIQMAVVLSVVGKFYYERATRPRVWVRAENFDPETPLRGRYLALSLLVDACGLPRDKAHFSEGIRLYNQSTTPGYWDWTVSLEARNGKLIPVLNPLPRDPNDTGTIRLNGDKPCDRATFTRRSTSFSAVDYFIPETAKVTLPSSLPGTLPKKDAPELWVEVTVPAEGPPRAIRLALSDGSGFHPLRFE